MAHKPRNLVLMAQFIATFNYLDRDSGRRRAQSIKGAIKLVEATDAEAAWAAVVALRFDRLERVSVRLESEVEAEFQARQAARRFAASREGQRLNGLKILAARQARRSTHNG